jgi:hypothetical protein
LMNSSLQIKIDYCSVCEMLCLFTRSSSLASNHRQHGLWVNATNRTGTAESLSLLSHTYFSVLLIKMGKKTCWNCKVTFTLAPECTSCLVLNTQIEYHCFSNLLHTCTNLTSRNMQHPAEPKRT